MMRKCIMTLFLLPLGILVAKAIPFIQEGKRWRISYVNYFYQERCFHPSYENWFGITGKENMGDVNYYLLQSEFFGIDSNTCNWEESPLYVRQDNEGEDNRFLIHIREDNGRVLIPKDDYTGYCKSCLGISPETNPLLAEGEDEILLYDFNLRAGNTYPFPGNVTVKETGEITYDDTAFSYQLLSNSLLIVEGIGCVNSYGGLIAYQSTPMFGVFDRFVTCFNWVVAEDYQKEIFQYQNVVSEDQLLGINEASINHLPQNRSIHDLQGRRLNGIPQKGIYIRNGRKYVR